MMNDFQQDREVSNFNQVKEMYRDYFGPYVQTDADKDFFNQLWLAACSCALFYLDEVYLKGFKYSKEEVTSDYLADKVWAVNNPFRPMKPFGLYQPVKRKVFTSGNKQYVLYTYYNHDTDFLFLRVFCD